MSVVHGVEGHHTTYVGRGDFQVERDLVDCFRGDPAVRLLRHPQRRQEQRLTSRILRRHRLEPGTTLGCEDGAGRCNVFAHLSTSPITISILALIAITSDKSAPSQSLGRTERLMNDGGLIRQRTGFAVPSETR